MVDLFTRLISRLWGSGKGKLLFFSTWGGTGEEVLNHSYHCFSIPKYYGLIVQKIGKFVFSFLSCHVKARWLSE